MVKELQELVGRDRQFLITRIFVLLDIMTGSGSYREGGLSTIRPGRQSSLGGGKRSERFLSYRGFGKGSSTFFGNFATIERDQSVMV
jgi:hypothetical protein